MGEPSVHPELQRANDFASAHADLLSYVFEEFVASGGEWPRVEQLQRRLERRDVDIDVGHLAWRMPKGVGFAEQERIVLRLRALMHIPAAQALLADWHAVLSLAYRRWRDSDDERDAVVRWPDITDELGISEKHAQLLVIFLSRESWALGSGGGEGDEWWRKVRSGVRVARGASDAHQLIAARDAVEYPPIDDPLVPTAAEVAGPARMVSANRAITGIPDMTTSPHIEEDTSPDRDRERKVMVVIGRDDAVNDALFAFLRAIDLKPMEWTQLVRETENAAPYIGEVLDQAMKVVQAVVVLCTPDDLVQLRPALVRPEDAESERQLTGQPRPNVLFEAGLAFGRHPTRTVLIEFGTLRGLSDLFGRHVVRLERGPAALHDLAGRLERAGCRVDTNGESWLDFSGFPAPPDVDAEAVAAANGDRDTATRRTQDLAPLERLVREILLAADHAVADDVVAEIARRIANLEGPTRGEVFDGLPGRMLPSETIKRVMYELERHGVLRRNDGPERGFLLDTLP